jgi:hypothetical protein
MPTMMLGQAVMEDGGNEGFLGFTETESRSPAAPHPAKRQIVLSQSVP